ncbi:manganese superoxide dismutase [Boletus reticuloceps]|uniref:Superoxide dismutase n=1 Tax=Boletus reticuloceps TaxID=495285 RepID=A0A8I2YM09_9AGAM|nr:manganese superoxide dismutase [Boletus reticuloceps]
MSGTHTLPNLPYSNNALEPYIIGEIMRLHHDKHHKTYIDALNAAENNYARATTPKERIALQSAIRFNGGGHINHSLFWKNLTPAPDGTHVKSNGGILKDGPLKDAIKRDFGSLEDFIKEFNSTTTAIQGSGWGWLAWNPKTKVLEVVTTPNQDPVLTHVPIIGVDVWEHAYYLQYFNARAAYLEKIWNVINWEEGEKRYNEAVSGSKL